nr:MAG TPA: putative tail fiber protein [Caudoviricetes sp.]
MENLFKVSKEGSVQIGPLLIQWGYINSFSNQYTLVFPVPFHEGTIPAITISTWQFSEMPLHNGRTNKVCPFYSGNRISIDWIAIGMA